MSVVQALAAMLSAGADANSRVQSAGLAANASLGNSANALRGDIYRANVHGQLGQQGIAADMQRNAGEQALRAMLGQGQLRMEGQRNNLAGQQLGLDRQRIASDRDLKLAELGIGPYAPKLPDMSDLNGGGQPAAPAAEQEYSLLDRLLGRRPVGGSAAAQPAGPRVDPAQEMIKRLFMANPNNPRMQAMMSDLLGQQQRQSQWQQEFDFKKGALSDPNALFAGLAPHVAGMEGVNPTNLGNVLATLKAQLGGGGVAPAQDAAAAPTFTQATQQLQSAAGNPLLQSLGIDPKMSGEQILDKVVPYETASYQFHKAPALKDPVAMAQLREFLKSRTAVDPSFAKPAQSLFGRDASKVETILKAIMDGEDPQKALYRNQRVYSAPSAVPMMRLGY